MFDYHFTYKIPKGGHATYADAIDKCMSTMVKDNQPYDILTDIEVDRFYAVAAGDTFKILVVSSNKSYIRMFTVVVEGRQEKQLSAYV